MNDYLGPEQREGCVALGTRYLLRGWGGEGGGSGGGWNSLCVECHGGPMCEDDYRNTSNFTLPVGVVFLRNINHSSIKLIRG